MIKTLIFRIWNFSIRYPVLAVILLFVSLDLFGRAGGGGSYSGGGGGGGGGGFNGGGGGDGDGIFIIIWLLIRLAIEHPVIGIPLAVIGIPSILFFMYKSQHGVKTYHRGRVIHRTRDMMNQNDLSRGLSAIESKHHGHFEKSAFLGRFETAFMKIQDAWCKQNLNTVRAFISDGIYERFSLQFDEQRDAGTRDHMEDIKILSTRIAHAEVDQVFETLSIRVEASAVDYKVDINTGKHASGKKRADRFVEYWTFIRKPGVEDRNGNGLIEGNCPNCGANLEVNESAKCDACQAVIKSGEYDWILSEITQECEWNTRSKKNLPGVQKVRSHDKQFSVQQLEDRASVIFWRYATSYRTGDTAPIRKMATDDCCQFLQERFALNDQGTRFIPGDIAVGAVDTLGVAVGEPMDQALVQVRWSAARISLAASGKKERVADSSVVNDIFVLERRHGAAGVQDGALSSAHCANCGAPVSDAASDACDYCGTVLNDGNTDWVLAFIGKPHDLKIKAIQKGFHGGLSVAAPGTPIRQDISGREVAAWMLKVMLADGVVDDKERKHIYAYADARHISRGEIDRMIDAASRGTLECPEPRSPEEAKEWLGGMARMALADGFVSHDEEKALLMLGKCLSYSAYDVKQLITQEQKLLYQESKRAMRELKLKGR